LSWTRQAGLPWRAMEVGWRRTSLASLGRLAEKALESCGTGRRQSPLARARKTKVCHWSAMRTAWRRSRVGEEAAEEEGGRGRVALREEDHAPVGWPGYERGLRRSDAANGLPA
jgi:hypothetical protein